MAEGPHPSDRVQITSTVRLNSFVAVCGSMRSCVRQGGWASQGEVFGRKVCISCHDSDGAANIGGVSPSTKRDINPVLRLCLPDLS